MEERPYRIPVRNPEPVELTHAAIERDFICGAYKAVAPPKWISYALLQYFCSTSSAGVIGTATPRCAGGELCFVSIALPAVAAVSCIALAAGTARAQDSRPSPDKSQYNLFNPTPRELMRAFSTDRPTKSNVPYTVDAGHFQYEGDIFTYGFDNITTPDTNITTWIIGNPTLKVGILNNLDFEVNFSAYNNIRSQTRSDGSSTTFSGFGDVITRAKINLFGNDGTGPALALIPYGKWPTASQGVGNRFVEGGIIAPLAVPLPLGFTGILMGEFDYLKNPNDNGYHANFPALININRTIVEGVTAYAEIYANWSTHRDVRDVYTLDFAVAWTPLPNFQLDVGINIGLNAAATPYQIYMGISQRF